jgi:hypoxanthine phosphoribosyltransferase
LVDVSNEREIMTWEMFGQASRVLAQMVADDYEPDMILSIARGGLLIGGALGYALSREERLHDERRVLHRCRRAPRSAAHPAAGSRLRRRQSDARILIADDVADTGHTLRSVQEFCAGKVAEVRTACLYQKSHSVVKCDYVWKHTDLWINFPWSDKDPVARRDWSVKDA